MKFKKTIFDKEKDISKIKTKEFDLSLVNAKDGDNGIMYFGRSSDFEFAEMTIDIVNDGAVSTGNVYPQPQRTGVLYNAYLIKPKFNISTSLLYFLSSTIKKSIKLKYSYENKASWNKVKMELLQLPIINNNQIDFDFMEAFIAELEAYLTTAGLKDYELTLQEQKALDEFEGHEFLWKNYNIKELFGASTRGKRLKSADRLSGDLPFVTTGEANSGVSEFICNDVTIFSANTTTIDMFGSAKYRNYEYGADDHVAVVHTGNLPKHAAIFITTSIHKSSYTGKFDYGSHFYAKDADELMISLPSENNKPDYSLMATLISAIQKLVIKDVVLFAERKITAHKQVV
uniref:Restriction enzyme BgcI subunit beta n=1 Tax=Arsenophonus endosymbiont of Trialeurodes vaporariorum TaxID=235567 RepID=A0A3B0MKQ0_9GAMM